MPSTERLIKALYPDVDRLHGVIVYEHPTAVTVYGTTALHKSTRERLADMQVTTEPLDAIMIIPADGTLAGPDHHLGLNEGWVLLAGFSSDP